MESYEKFMEKSNLPLDLDYDLLEYFGFEDFRKENYIHFIANILRKYSKNPEILSDFLEKFLRFEDEDSFFIKIEFLKTKFNKNEKNFRNTDFYLKMSFLYSFFNEEILRSINSENFYLLFAKEPTEFLVLTRSYNSSIYIFAAISNYANLRFTRVPSSIDREQNRLVSLIFFGFCIMQLSKVKRSLEFDQLSADFVAKPTFFEAVVKECLDVFQNSEEDLSKKWLDFCKHTIEFYKKEADFLKWMKSFNSVYYHRSLDYRHEFRFNRESRFSKRLKKFYDLKFPANHPEILKILKNYQQKFVRKEMRLYEKEFLPWSSLEKSQSMITDDNMVYYFAFHWVSDPNFCNLVHFWVGKWLKTTKKDDYKLFFEYTVYESIYNYFNFAKKFNLKIEMFPKHIFFKDSCPLVYVNRFSKLEFLLKNNDDLEDDELFYKKLKKYLCIEHIEGNSNISFKLLVYFSPPETITLDSFINKLSE
jgi:hypothetical protein